MTRRDFQLIADVIREAQWSREYREALALRFADRLAATNPQFNRSRFLKAALPDKSGEVA